MDQFNPQNPQNPQYQPNNGLPPNTPPQAYPQQPPQYPPQNNSQFAQQPQPNYNYNQPPSYPQQPATPNYASQPQPQYQPQPNYAPPQSFTPPSKVQMPNHKSVATKVQEFFYILLVALELLLGVRFVLRLIGANPLNPVVNTIYEFTGVFITPYKGFFSYGILNNTRVLQSVLEWETLIAMGITAILGFIVVKLIDLFR